MSLLDVKYIQKHSQSTWTSLNLPHPLAYDVQLSSHTTRQFLSVEIISRMKKIGRVNYVTHAYSAPTNVLNAFFQLHEKHLLCTFLGTLLL